MLHIRCLPVYFHVCCIYVASLYIWMYGCMLFQPKISCRPGSFAVSSASSWRSASSHAYAGTSPQVRAVFCGMSVPHRQLLLAFRACRWHQSDNFCRPPSAELLLLSGAVLGPRCSRVYVVSRHAAQRQEKSPHLTGMASVKHRIKEFASSCRFRPCR